MLCSALVPSLMFRTSRPVLGGSQVCQKQLDTSRVEPLGYYNTGVAGIERLLEAMLGARARTQGLARPAAAPGRAWGSWGAACLPAGVAAGTGPLALSRGQRKGCGPSAAGWGCRGKTGKHHGSRSCQSKSTVIAQTARAFKTRRDARPTAVHACHRTRCFARQPHAMPQSQLPPHLNCLRQSAVRSVPRWNGSTVPLHKYREAAGETRRHRQASPENAMQRCCRREIVAPAGTGHMAEQPEALIRDGSSAEAEWK